MVYSSLVETGWASHSLIIGDGRFIIMGSIIGGGTDLQPGTRYFDAAQAVYAEAVAANGRGDYFPLWYTRITLIVPVDVTAYSSI